MSSANITRRFTRSGQPRFVVRYRLGGRGTPLLHDASFRTRKEAEQRRQLMLLELAAGRDPAQRDFVPDEDGRIAVLSREKEHWRRIAAQALSRLAA